MLLTDANEIGKLREAILKDLSIIEAALFEEAEGLGYYHFDSDYRVNRSKIHSASIKDVRIVALGVGECTLTFAADIEAEHLLKWENWDQNYEEYDESSEFEAWFLETSPVTGTAKVSLDTSSGKIKEITLIKTDIAEIEVTERPIRW